MLRIYQFVDSTKSTEGTEGTKYIEKQDHRGHKGYREQYFLDNVTRTFVPFVAIVPLHPEFFVPFVPSVDFVLSGKRISPCRFNIFGWQGKMFEHRSDHVRDHNGERRLKVVVFGSYHSGKTSLIRAINPDAHGTEVRNKDGTTTVAFDLGIREHQGIKLYFYGTPGQERFEVAREVVAFGLHIGLVLADATRGMTVFEQHLHSELKAHGIPCIVLASKTDLPGASIDLIRRGAGEGATVMGVSAATGAGIDALLDRIVEMATTL